MNGIPNIRLVNPHLCYLLRSLSWLLFLMKSSWFLKDSSAWIQSIYLYNIIVPPPKKSSVIKNGN
jgi:hypothetical protein